VRSLKAMVKLRTRVPPRATLPVHGEIGVEREVRGDEAAGVGFVVGFQKLLLRAETEGVGRGREPAEVDLREQAGGAVGADVQNHAQRILRGVALPTAPGALLWTFVTVTSPIQRPASEVTLRADGQVDVHEVAAVGEAQERRVERAGGAGHLGAVEAEREFDGRLRADDDSEGGR
jgi:hypothetical protein